MKTGIGVNNSAVASTEVRRLTRVDAAEFWRGYAEKTEKHNIRFTNVTTFDEFNDFMNRSGSHVQSSATERRMVTGRRVEKTSQSRITLTAAILFLHCAGLNVSFSYTIALGQQERRLRKTSRTSSLSLSKEKSSMALVTCASSWASL